MRFAKLFSSPAKPGHIIFALLCATSVSLVTSTAHGFQREERFENWEQSDGPIDTGLLFVNDEFVPGPYDVQVSETQVTVNGVLCFEIDQQPAAQRNDDWRDGNRRNDQRREPGFFGQQGGRGGEPGARGRRGGPGGRGERGERGGRAEPPGGRMISSLVTDNLVVIRTGIEAQYMNGKNMYTFCNAMTADSPTPEQIKAFAALSSGQEHHAHWKKWLLSFKPDGDLFSRMQAEVERSDNMIATTDAKVLAMGRLETFNYPLTIAGMLLSVLALGHLLKWATKIVMAESSANASGDIIRCAEIALLLMLAMSAIDLVWTILAGQAGVMREINPLAAGLIKTPVQLVAFKVVATGIGFAILYAWRRRSQIQQATWWMCLVCVLLTFRWVVFDSVMN